MILLRSENQKLKSVYEQKIENLERKVDFYQKRESQVKKSKKDMIEMIDSLGERDKVSLISDY